MKETRGLSRRGLGAAIAAGALRTIIAGALAAGPGALVPGAFAAGGPPDPNVVYEFDVPLAPVCLEGSFPLTLELASGNLPGTIDLTTDAKGRLSGNWTTGLAVIPARGTVKFTEGTSLLKLVISRPGDHIALKGSLEPVGFTGGAVGKGFLAPGKNTFTLLTAGAPVGVARIGVVFPPGSGKHASGQGTAALCNDQVALKAVRQAGKSMHLSMAGGGVQWSGTGPAGAVPGDATVAWKAKGWGGSASGSGLPLSLVPPPATLTYADPAPTFEAEEAAAPDLPSTSGGPVESWTVDPPLPDGLTLDAGAGAIAGTPSAPLAAADYTVTAGNLAGSTTAVVNLGVRGNRAYSFAPQATALSDDDYRHFLSRTHFGVKASELAAVKAAGLPAYLDDILVFKSGTAIETAAFAELVNPSDPPALQGGFPNGYQMSRWWERIMMDTDRPFQEVMAFFWHDHMPTSYDVLGGGYTHFWVDYANLLRHQGSGNFRDLMLAISRNESMLVYLDGVSNSKYAPNENFAREFWELFTLGVDDGYTQADIQQAAKAWTGYRFRYDAATGRYSVIFDPNLHDTGTKNLFGTTIPAQNAGDDYAAVVDITLANKPVDKFITKKIFEYFCYNGPPQALVDTMAARLRSSNWELKPFLKDLFLSEAFFSNRSQAGRAKGPVEYTVGLMRTTGLKLTMDYVDYLQYVLVQRPGEPPTVNGWPLGTLWFSAAAMVNRTNAAWYVLNDVARQNSLGMNVANILPAPAQRTDQAVVDTVSTLMKVPLTSADRSSLLDYLNTQRQANGVVVPSAFNGSSQAQLDERVRGLIYILAQNPAYQVK